MDVEMRDIVDVFVGVKSEKTVNGELLGSRLNVWVVDKAGNRHQVAFSNRGNGEMTVHSASSEARYDAIAKAAAISVQTR